MKHLLIIAGIIACLLISSISHAREYTVITIKATLPEAATFGQVQSNLRSWTITGKYEDVINWNKAPIWISQPSGTEYKVFCIDVERVTNKATGDGVFTSNPRQWLLDNGYEPVEVLP